MTNNERELLEELRACRLYELICDRLESDPVIHAPFGPIVGFGENYDAVLYDAGFTDEELPKRETIAKRSEIASKAKLLHSAMKKQMDSFIEECEHSHYQYKIFSHGYNDFREVLEEAGYECKPLSYREVCQGWAPVDDDRFDRDIDAFNDWGDDEEGDIMRALSSGNGDLFGL